ncbi:MAG: hypothetical protein RI566_13005 [Sediminimonas sp.]|uniref:hypothetical protein n=1 Tax=Sediminimonas sp. TaxID=2823379 RepID=UPI0028707B14|nr:hypothetical protein [Sediminimonas sp.]MDR9486083.1 hypothetical protein [Sediminimonas sp.]
MSYDTERLVQSLLDRRGSLFSDELGIDLARNTPSPLFRWLCAALLMSARISYRTAVDAARALSDQGWTTAGHMAESAWEDRVKALNQAGYGRFDERSATMLGDTAERLCTDYGGDLRRLRAAAGEAPRDERARLKAFKGIGDVGADIFFREVQIIWPEHFPFLDRKARDAARRLGLPDTAEALADMVGTERFAHLAAALVRAELDGISADDLLAPSGEVGR